MSSSFATRLHVTPFDSTMASVLLPPLPARIASALRRSRDFARALRETRPDAVLLLCGSGLSFVEKAVLARYARWRGVPSMLAPRAGDVMRQLRRSTWTRRVGRWLFGGPSLVVCQGEYWRDFVVREMQVPVERFEIVPSWTASAELLAIGAERATRERALTTSITLLFLGWLDDSKGVFELLEAITALAADPSLPPHRLELAGEGNASASARAFVRDRGLTNVEFLSWVRDEAKLAMLRRADLFVLPSWHEGFPNAMIEAMASGLPVVVTPVGAIPETVEDERDATLVPVRDTAALTSALTRLLHDSTRRRRLGRAAHLTATQRFGVERAADQLVALVQRLAQRRPD